MLEALVVVIYGVVAFGLLIAVLRVVLIGSVLTE